MLCTRSFWLSPMSSKLFLAGWFLALIAVHLQASHHTLVDERSKNGSSLITLPLFHRDDPSSPLQKGRIVTMDKRRGNVMASMLRRDNARVQGISTHVRRTLELQGSRAEQDVLAHVEKRANLSAAPVSTGSADGSGEFFTRMGIGYRDFLLVMDTGSDLVWLQCLPCQNCYEQNDPLFNPASSSSLSPVDCQSGRCSQSDIMTCRGRACQYQQSYGDGSFTTGSVVTDDFYIGNTLIRHGIMMGCGHDNEGLFVGAAGLLGLGRGPLSFPSQVASQTGGVFSYCLSATGPGTLIFGQESETNEESNRRVHTELLTNPIEGLTYYYVPLVGISIDGQVISGIRESDLSLRSSGRGGVILDSGTTITRFVGAVYYPMRDAFREEASVRGYRPSGGYSIFDTCYFLPTGDMETLPTIELHFQGGSLLSLPPENTVYPIDDEGPPMLCLAFAPTSNEFSILGNVQQQGFLITFDTTASRIGFLKNQCSLPPQ